MGVLLYAKQKTIYLWLYARNRGHAEQHLSIAGGGGIGEMSAAASTQPGFGCGPLRLPASIDDEGIQGCADTALDPGG